MKTQIFYKKKYDFRGNLRSHNANFMFENQLFLRFIFV